MFILIPCVDIQKAKAVRLYEGNPDRETVYFDSPLEAAKHWHALGAEWLHVVDLDAALGTGDNSYSIKEMAETLDLKIELGGGIRSFEAAAQWLEVVDRIVLGTLALTQPELLDALLERFGTEKIVVSIDAKEGMVAVKGWLELTKIAATELARRVLDQGVSQIIYTDISRDGTMLGVNERPVEEMRLAFPHSLIAGGGVAGPADIELYKRLGLQGAIVGRALYEGKIPFPYEPK